MSRRAGFLLICILHQAGLDWFGFSGETLALPYQRTRSRFIGVSIDLASETEENKGWREEREVRTPVSSKVFFLLLFSHSPAIALGMVR